MKRRVAVLIVISMLAMLFAGCEVKPKESPKDAESTGGPEKSLQERFDAIEPLDEEVALNIGIGAGILHDFPAYLAWKAGGLEKANVKGELKYFANGPLMVEAITAKSLDVGGYGIGGILAGSVLKEADIIQLRMEEAIVQKYFVKADSDIAKAGIDEKTGFYGTKEQWKGKQVYLPQGTTLQYLLGEALAKMDMTFDDIEPVYMDAKNVNTAIYADQGDAWALWNMYGYSAGLEDDYVEAFNGVTAGISLLAASVARKDALDDPQLKAAIGKWVECQYAVIDWMQESEENMNAAVDYFYEWCQEEGVMAEKDDLYRYMNDAQFYNARECYDLMVNKGDSGMLVGEEMILNPMDFFISQGNYTEADKEKLTDGNFDPEFVEALIK